MAQAPHTVGPWVFRATGWNTNPFAIYSPRRPGAVACVPSRTSVPMDEQFANAQLIAAAPQLLSALEDILESTCEALSFLDKETIKHLKPLIDSAEIAIAKAKGE